MFTWFAMGHKEHFLWHSVTDNRTIKTPKPQHNCEMKIHTERLRQHLTGRIQQVCVRCGAKFMLLIAENIIPDYFPDPLAQWTREGVRVLASFKHTSPETGMFQSVTNAGESQWAFDYPAVKPVVWSGNVWIGSSTFTRGVAVHAW